MAALQQGSPAALMVNIAAIPDEGLAFHTEVAASVLDVPPEAAQELPTPIQVRGRLTKVAEQVYFQGTIRGTLAVPCSRCIDIIHSDFATDVRVVFLPPSARLETAGEEGVDTEDELDLYTHDGITLDLQPLVHDHVLLALPIQVLCRPECAGLCQVCGENRNEVQCACEAESADPRFALLQQLRFPKKS
ncbi:MAG: DUF177 domain-containing protein [Candidatus Tectimicrobiota bacterium]